MRKKHLLLSTAVFALLGHLPVSNAAETIHSMKQETITVKGMEAHTEGSMPSVGSMAPDFKGTRSDLSDVSLSDFKGKKIILNIFPSLDTPTCAVSVRTFNEKASSLQNTVVLCLSMDLPFAQNRFCTTEGIENVIPLSLFRDNTFAEAYGLKIADSPLRGLMSRAVIVIDETGKIVYTELVNNVSEEPNYDAALKAAAKQ